MNDGIFKWLGLSITYAVRRHFTILFQTGYGMVLDNRNSNTHTIINNNNKIDDDQTKSVNDKANNTTLQLVNHFPDLFTL